MLVFCKRGVRIRKLKSIDSIYQEVKDCCFVLTNDAPLATALNKLVDKPLIGPFAMTARQLAASVSVEVIGYPIWGELKAVKTICEENPELDFRFVHDEMQKIREIRQYTMDVEKHLSSSSKKVYNSWKAIPTLEMVMERFDQSKTFYPELHGTIAVINIDMFNDLDKNMIPNEYDYLDVDIFENEQTYIPEIYQIGNDRQIAENAVALIEDNDPNNFAIVMNASSPIVDAVKTTLYRKKIPFIDSLTVRDLNQVRDYLQFLHLSLNYETLRAKQVREMYSALEAHMRSDVDEHLLDKIFLDGKAEKLRSLMKDIRKHTFDEVRQIICDAKTGDAVKNVIEDLDIGNAKISTRLVERMTYAVDNIADLHHNEKIPKNEKTGVLLVDSRNSVFVDRPLVIYLGMGDDWDLDLADKKYVDDIEEETRRMAAKLEALVQQGVGRYYLVNTSKNGKPAKPSILFSRLFEITGNRETLEFEDLLLPGHTTLKKRWCDYKQTEGIELKDRLDGLEPYSYKFSQSGFKAYYECPYSFQFYSTLESKDADYFEFGNLIHSFAELYFSHPELANDRFEELVQMACKRFSGISSPAMGTIDADRIRYGMTNVKRYIDGLGFEGDRKLVPVPKGHDNFFYEELGLHESSAFCEHDYESNEHRIHGKFDLNLNTVIDYKSGKARDAYKIRKAMNIVEKREQTDFQALFYLAISNEVWSNKEMQFLYAMGNDTQHLDNDFDVKENVRKVLIYDPSNTTFDVDKIIADMFRKGRQNKCKKRSGDFVNLMKRVAQGVRTTWAEDESIIAAISKEFNYDSKGRKTVINAIKEYVKILDSGILYTDNTILISEEKLHEIMNRIDSMHTKMQSESISELPADHDKNCFKCNFFKVCTKDGVTIDVKEDDSDE